LNIADHTFDTKKQTFTEKDIADAIQYGCEMQFRSTNEYYENVIGFIAAVADEHENQDQ